MEMLFISHDYLVLVNNAHDIFLTQSGHLSARVPPLDTHLGSIFITAKRNCTFLKS